MSCPKYIKEFTTTLTDDRYVGIINDSNLTLIKVTIAWVLTLNLTNSRAKINIGIKSVNCRAKNNKTSSYLNFGLSVRNATTNLSNFNVSKSICPKYFVLDSSTKKFEVSF